MYPKQTGGAKIDQLIFTEFTTKFKNNFCKSVLSAILVRYPAKEALLILSPASTLAVEKR